MLGKPSYIVASGFIWSVLTVGSITSRVPIVATDGPDGFVLTDSMVAALKARLK